MILFGISVFCNYLNPIDMGLLGVLSNLIPLTERSWRKKRSTLAAIKVTLIGKTLTSRTNFGILA